MKRIYMTLGLMGALTVGATAQVVDMEAYIQLPASGTLMGPGQVLDTTTVQCYLIYNGPDDIATGIDYVSFMSPFSVPANDSQFYIDGVSFGQDITIADSGMAIFRFPNANEIGAGHIAPNKLSADSISYLYDWELYNTLDSFSIISPPYVNGKDYGFFFRSVGVRDQSGGGVTAVDPVPENNRDVVKIKWSTGVGIGEMFVPREKSQIDVYPNPATSVINFKFEFEKNSHAQGVIRDVTGRIVRVRNFGQALPGTQTYSMDITRLAAGNYTLEFNTDEKTAVTKFTIAK